MIFVDAYMAMLAGHKIKRPCFEGYWYIDGVDGKLKIHLANGKEISEGELGLTVMNCCAEDWCIAQYKDIECSKMVLHLMIVVEQVKVMRLIIHLLISTQ